MGSRRQSRESALQILYLMDVGKLSREDASVIYWRDNPLPPRSKGFAEQLVTGAAGKRAGLDDLITKYAENWEISRMAAIDRNILRLASYELVYHGDTPVSV